MPLGPLSPSPFHLVPDWAGPCVATSSSPIDINLGHSPTSFITSAHCQITGSPPNASTLSHWVAALIPSDYLRRIDVVRSLCALHPSPAPPPHPCPPLTYSNP